MNPVGRFLRAVLPQGKQTADLRPGTVVHATVERSIGSGHWLLRVGSQRFTAKSHISLQTNQSLQVIVEKSQQGMIFRVVAPSGGNEVLDRLLGELGFTDTSVNFRSVLESFVQVGLPLHEQLTVPALRQFDRLLREFPQLQKRYRETARYIAMFTDRGLRVPDEMIVELIGSDMDDNAGGQTKNPRDNRDPGSSAANQDEATQNKAPQGDEDDPCLLLPDSSSRVPGAAAWLTSLRGREDVWRIVPVAFGSSTSNAAVRGEIRMQMVQGEPHAVVLDVAVTHNRWVFCWNQKSGDYTDVYTSDMHSVPAIRLELQQLVTDLGLGSNYSVYSIEQFNGFVAAQDEQGVTNVFAQR